LDRRGEITLYDNSFECLESYTDTDGRVAMIVIEKQLIKTVCVNFYCPNDYKTSYVFMEKVYYMIQ
jgi:hypothetical protein